MRHRSSVFSWRRSSSASSTQRFLAVVCYLSLAVLFTIASDHAMGQSPFEEDEFRRGLIGTYRSGHGEFQRIDSALDFLWSRKVETRLAAGPFSADWSGFLMSQATGDYRFHAYLQGEVEVTLNGKVLLQAEREQPGWVSSDTLRLPFDWHPLHIAFAAPSSTARFSLFWEGPKFGLEPIPERQFYHDPQTEPPLDKLAAYERGEEVVRALRCQACHALGDAAQLAEHTVLAAPSLVHAAGTLHPEWIQDWLTGHQNASLEQRRMPYFALTAEQSRNLAAFLADPTRVKGKPPLPDTRVEEKPDSPDSKTLKAGRSLLLSVGCLACHQFEGLGNGGIYGGGNLTRIAEKRPAGFFETWLRAPEKLNPSHRMPVFQLTDDERQQLAGFLSQSGEAPRRHAEWPEDSPPKAEAVSQGRQLFEQFRCVACHQANGSENRSEKSFTKPTLWPVSRLSAESDWERACTGTPEGHERQPRYGLSKEDAAAARAYVAEVSRRKAIQQPQGREPQKLRKGAGVRGGQLMREHNCVTCHARTDRGGLGEIVNDIASQFPELAAQVPAMTPPSLLSVGDKLHDEALRDAILRKGPVHRPWLSVRMPKFRLASSETDAIAEHLITADRIPDNAPFVRRHPAMDQAAMELAGPRLVSTDGFGCTSCHQVGKVSPPKAPLNAKGPDLLLLGQRIRRPWFDRWVRNPARIIPRMEMPSVEIAVRGVLDEDIDQQLGAVWETLNQSNFVPPQPNPVRVLRLSGIESREERAEVITDVVRVNDRSFLKPMLIALPNRHSILFDLETARLQRWTIGDAARQRTEGKTWFWEAAGSSLSNFQQSEADIQLQREGDTVAPIRQGQFATEFDWFEHHDRGIQVAYRLHFPKTPTKTREQDAESSEQVAVVQSFVPRFASSGGDHGFDRTLTSRRVPEGARVLISVVPSTVATQAKLMENGKTLLLDDTGSVRVRVLEPTVARIRQDGTILLPPAEDGVSQLRLRYETDLPIDQFPIVPPPPFAVEAEPLDIVPGFRARRLPIDQSVMPTGLDWDEQGTLYLTSLKGRVWRLQDADGDGLEEQLTQFSDELAAPFGLVANPTPPLRTNADGATGLSPSRYLDVINKYALLRLIDKDGDGRADRTVTLASGWGHTTDYHDWAIGIPRDEQGNYYISIACQQDERTDAGAYLRGTVVRLVPREPSVEDPRPFSLDPISGGHRFPIGIARNRRGELYVTDNQGNYNPFNELNHVVRGARYGFINRNERRPGFNPPLTPPAINIPHPWTRSVNGICFLESPRNDRSASPEPDVSTDAPQDSNFGPFEGQLVGCEYDTRRLVRMSLQWEGDTVQGAVYPFSLYHPEDGKTFLGPIACAVSPEGELYVGCIRDSGWGGANNIGGIVKLRFDAATLPPGIAEVTARPAGFAIDFTQPVDQALAANPNNYSISSYRRISTPAYGGEDVDRRTESIQAVHVSEDGKRVLVNLDRWREGFVYEIRCKQLVDDEQQFFPAEAYYTLRAAPQPDSPSGDPPSE